MNGTGDKSHNVVDSIGLDELQLFVRSIEVAWWSQKERKGAPVSEFQSTRIHGDVQIWSTPLVYVRYAGSDCEWTLRSPQSSRSCMGVTTPILYHQSIGQTMLNET